jgi:hypothetical protein
MTKPARSAIVKQVTAMWRSHSQTPAIVSGLGRQSLLLYTLYSCGSENAGATIGREDDWISQADSLVRMYATSWHVDRVQTNNRPRHEPRLRNHHFPIRTHPTNTD